MEIALTNHSFRRERRQSYVVLPELTKRILSVHECGELERNHTDARESKPFVIEPVIDRNDIQFVGLGLTENSFNDALQESDECQVVVLS